MRRFVPLLIVFLPWPAPAAQPMYREIKDFVVGCDNGGACQALGLAQEDGGDPLLLDLRRDAGPGGGATLRLSSAKRFAAHDLRVDGRATALSSLPWRDVGDTEGGALELQDAGSIEKFVDVARNAGAIAVGRGEEAAELSLSGFSAALLLIDETQGRLGNETAWMRRGAKPASTVPPAAVLPVMPPPRRTAALSQAQAVALIAAVRRHESKLLASEECDAPEPDISPDSAYALNGDDALVLLNCLNGAYQSASLAFRIDRAGRGPARRVILQAPIKIGENDGRIDYFTNAEYFPDTATLFHSAKGRGLADCGEAATWRFDGREFRLASYAYLGRCSGAEPGNWPALFRSSGR